MPMKTLLVHGMGRTPLSMAVLAARLRAAGMQPHFFAYVAALESWDSCVARLRKFVEKNAPAQDYILIGHSLGAVLIRAALPGLASKPAACFFLAPPSRACLAARRFETCRLYRLLTGEMGRHLAAPEFMASLPMPVMPATIYAGTAGPRGVTSPFRGALNDGLLMLDETSLPSIPMRTVPRLHTFIMNDGIVAADIIAVTKSLSASDARS